jgi:hypothetical protein
MNKTLTLELFDDSHDFLLELWSCLYIELSVPLKEWQSPQSNILDLQIPQKKVNMVVISEM